jgi:hypothetical protein
VPSDLWAERYITYIVEFGTSTVCKRSVYAFHLMSYHTRGRNIDAPHFVHDYVPLDCFWHWLLFYILISRKWTHAAWTCLCTFSFSCQQICFYLIYRNMSASELVLDNVPSAYSYHRVYFAHITDLRMLPRMIMLCTLKLLISLKVFLHTSRGCDMCLCLCNFTWSWRLNYTSRKIIDVCRCYCVYVPPYKFAYGVTY